MVAYEHKVMRMVITTIKHNTTIIIYTSRTSTSFQTLSSKNKALKRLLAFAKFIDVQETKVY